MSGSTKLRNKGSVGVINNEDYFYLAKNSEGQGDGKTTIGDLKEAFGVSNVPGYKLVGRKIYTASGVWSKDLGVDAVIVEVQGAGGGGNSSNRSGGAGGYTKKFITAGLGATEIITIGAGGVPGSNGTSSSFGSHCSAGGGFANTSGNGQGGFGGSASGGDENELGQPGEANPSYPGGNAGPCGGKSKLGTGGVGGSATVGGAGSRGGGGGGGSTGGSGGDGVIIISEYTSGQEIAAPVISGIIGYKLIIRKTFSTTGTWIKSLGTDAILVKLVGSGGGGGGAPGGGSAAGGGSGGYAESFITSGFGSSETVIIGNGGTPGAAGAYNNGSAGGSTSFGSHLSASSGGGGVSGGLAGGGGTGGVGTVNNGIGWTANGQPGEQTATYSAGNGGPSLFGGGGKGGTSGGPLIGTVGSNGGGGGGGWTSGGGAGGPGLVIVEEYALDTSGDQTLKTSPSFSASQGVSGQPVPSGVLTKVVLNQKTFDTNSWFDEITDYKFTPKLSGIYHFVGAIRSITSLTTGGSLGIYKNGILLQEKIIPSGGDAADISVTAEMNGISDYIELQITSNSNSIVLDHVNKRTNLYGTYTGRQDQTAGSINRRVVLSNNTLDLLNDIDFSEGVFQFSDYTGKAKLLPLIKKLDANWALGNNQGMLDVGVKQISTTYHIFAIYNPTTQVSDVLASINLSPALPVGFTKYKRIWSVITLPSGDIKRFNQYNNECHWKTPTLDVNVSNLGTSGVLYPVSVPSGVIVKSILNCFITGAGGEDVLVSNPAMDDMAPSKSAAPLAGNLVNPGGGSNGPFHVITNSSAQIRARSTNSGTVFRVSTIGWIDFELEI